MANEHTKRSCRRRDGMAFLRRLSRWGPTNPAGGSARSDALHLRSGPADCQRNPSMISVHEIRRDAARLCRLGGAHHRQAGSLPARIIPQGPEQEKRAETRPCVRDLNGELEYVLTLDLCAVYCREIVA